MRRRMKPRVRLLDRGFGAFNLPDPILPNRHPLHLSSGLQLLVQAGDDVRRVTLFLIVITQPLRELFQSGDLVVEMIVDAMPASQTRRIWCRAFGHRDRRIGANDLAGAVLPYGTASGGRAASREKTGTKLAGASDPSITSAPAVAGVTVQTGGPA